MGKSAVPIDLDALVSMESEIDPAVVTALMDDPFARYVVVGIHGRDAISLDHLAEIVAGFDAVDSQTLAGPADLDRILVRLHHVTLPKLDAIGDVTFDHEEGTVTNEGISDAIFDVLGVEE